MGVGYCEVPMSIVNQDITFMSIESGIEKMKRDAREAENKRNNKG